MLGFKAAAVKESTAHYWVEAMPLVFVVMWSTGFIVAKFGLPYAPPLTFLFLRFFGVALVLLPLVLLMRAPWPKGQVGNIALSGVLVHAGYVGGIWSAINLGVPAGLAALIAGLQPLLTAFAAPMVGESVRRRQWIGFLLGLGGVALVVSNKVSVVGLSWESIALCVFALFSITIGTLYQKRHCAHFDLRSGTLIQFTASFIVVLPFAVWLEGMDATFGNVEWAPNFIGALLWSILALSIGAVFLLFALIRKSAATKVSSLMYLTPPTTALMAWAMFGEVFTLVGIAGMLLAVTGVYFVVGKK